MILPIVLVIRFAMFPGFPPIHFERFESESECHVAAAELDKSTKVVLDLQCEVDT